MIEAKRDKKCRACGNWFKASNTLHRACSPLCAIAVAKQDEARAQRREMKERRDRIKTKRELTKEAQQAFNKFIRTRDADQPCICCGQLGGDESWKPGGEWDAGHYLSVGSHPELRFDELNCHKQLKSCNAGSGRFTRKNYTVGQEYRERLIAKIGQEAVEYLEGPHDQKNYTPDDLREIRDYYRKRTRELEAAGGSGCGNHGRRPEGGEMTGVNELAQFWRECGALNHKCAARAAHKIDVTAREVWHPVSEPPTEADGDSFGEVLISDGKVVHMEPWDQYQEWTRPGTKWARIRDVVLLPPADTGSGA